MSVDFKDFVTEISFLRCIFDSLGEEGFKADRKDRFSLETSFS